MFYFGIADREFLKALNRMANHADNPSPCLKSIGEDLKESTKKRFETATTPDGTPWKDNASVTIARKGENKPLIGETHTLKDTINYQIYGDTLAIGSSEEYAAMQQFGGTKSEFPNLWGDIPARQFLGISLEDENNILNTISDYISN
ncbi:MAG: phage virion morphogenesis protein [Methylococcales bacterium]